MSSKIEEIPLKYYRGRCRCCLSDGYLRSLIQKYETESGEMKTLGEVFFECFREELAPKDSEKDQYLICESCVFKLDDCDAFRKTVSQAKANFDQPETNERMSSISDGGKSCDFQSDYTPWDDVWDDLKKEPRAKKRKRRIATDRPSLPYKLEAGNLTCMLCRETFFSTIMLNSHMNVHYPNFICDFCGKAFAAKTRLLKHLKSHIKSCYPCDLCDRTYSTYKSRYSHMRQYHGKLTYRCPKCRVRFATYDARLQHMIKEHGEEARRHRCTLCPAAFMRAGTLSAHRRTVHFKEKSKTCDVCGASFFTKSMLDNHMACHSNKREHLCHICHRSYARRKTLLAHMKTHNKEKTTEINHSK